MLNEGQRLDTIEPVDGKRYMHHYNFPPYCTGETGRMGTPKRREIGHGNLAERALIPVLPDENEFPYAIRVVSEVMESNGSSSMASTCGSCLALMDGGVPIKRPVSGIAMGLIQEEGKTVVLSDIQGLEDFLGDMDFKVTGTEKGITALQMDNKATGLTFDILRTALEQAKEGRAYILDKMLEVVPGPREETRTTAPKIQCITLEQAKEGRAYILDKMLEVVPGPREETRTTAPKIQCITIPTENIRDVIGKGGETIRGIQDETGASIVPGPREETRTTAPKIQCITIPTENIRDVIGKGGETIRGIQDETGASIDIHEDGTVYVGGVGESVAAAIERIELIVKVPEVGEVYTGRVVSIQPFGAFVNLLPGKDGLLHISRVAQGRVEKVEDVLNVGDEVEKVEDVLNVGDEVKVKVIEIDDRGKISLDRLEKPEAPAGAGRGEGEGRGERRELNVGDEVKVKVIEIDDRGKISLDRLEKPEAPAGAGRGEGEGRGERRERGDRPGRGARDTGARGFDRPARRERGDRPRRPGDNGGRAPRRHHEAE